MRLPLVILLVVSLLFPGCGSDDDNSTIDATTIFDAAKQDGAVVDAPTASACQSPAPTEVVDVSVAELYQRITDGDSLAVVDVREPDETAAGVIEGALLYPWSSGVLEADHAGLPDNLPLFVICRSGSRSAAASAFLFANGHACVHNVLGGMNAWTGAGYPIVSP